MKDLQPRRELPLAGRATTPDQFIQEREAELARLVDHFYSVARIDPLLGPVFESRVSDWDEHLEAVRDFWSAAVYHTGRYRGRPLEVHRRIDQLSPAHFARWLILWEQSVGKTVSSDASEPLVAMARRMSDKMLPGSPTREREPEDGAG
jgi:hemoglobin